MQGPAQSNKKQRKQKINTGMVSDTCGSRTQVATIHESSYDNLATRATLRLRVPQYI